jgi:hypothetical protein
VPHLGVRLITSDDPVRTVLGEPKGAAPGVQGAQPISPTDQVQHMDERPHDVRREAGELHPARVRHSVRAGDRRHAAFVEILEGRHAGITIETRPNPLSDVIAFLNRRLRDTRKSVERHHVTDCKDFRMTG